MLRSWRMYIYAVSSRTSLFVVIVLVRIFHLLVCAIPASRQTRTCAVVNWYLVN